MAENVASFRPRAHPLPDDVLHGDIAILGKKGGGKTVTAKGIVERKLDLRERVLILDPLGGWPGLRTGADGTTPGYPIAIVGGVYADLPLELAAAEPLAEVIARENLPAVIDLSEVSKTQQQSFLAKFLHALRRMNREALTVVLEEADVFAPQNPLGDDSKLLHSEIDWISRRGRFRGFTLVSVTQRPARLSKDVLTQAATLIAHRLPAPQDSDAVMEWVKGNGDVERAKEVRASLATLDTGEAWVWASESDFGLQRVKMPMIRTLDTTATPKVGQSRIEPKTLADVDVSKIEAALAEAHQEQPKPSLQNAPRIDVAAIEKTAHDRGYRAGYADGLSDGLSRAVEAVQRVKGADAGPEAPKPPARPLPSPQAIDTGVAETMRPLARQILEVIHGVRPQPIQYRTAAIRAGASPRSSAFLGYRKDIEASGTVTVLDDGRLRSNLAGSGDRQSARVDDWQEKLTPTEFNILRAIADARRPITREAATQAAGLSQTSSGPGKAIRDLAEIELIIKGGDGLLSLNREVFSNV